MALEETVTISQARYEELLDDETRIDVLCYMLVRKDLEIEDIFSILGESHLIEKYKARYDKEKTEREEMLTKYRDSMESEEE